MNTFLHHLFIPSENNNYRARALHIDFLSYSLLLIIMVAFLYKTTPFINILGIASDISISRLYDLTNQKRIENGCQVLNNNPALAAAACQKAADMFAKNYWAHYGPNGESPWSFIKNSGYLYEFAGENLCKNFDNSEGCINAWMASPSHKANILRCVYQDVGFCVMNGSLEGEDTTLVVQIFGKPISDGQVALAKPATAQESNSALKTLPKTIPTALPTHKPVLAPTETPSPTSIMIAAAKPEKPKNWTNIASLFAGFNISALFFLILFAALIFDFYYAYRLKLVRLTGKHIAHFIFIGVIFVSLFILKRGAIL